MRTCGVATDGSQSYLSQLPHLSATLTHTHPSLLHLPSCKILGLQRQPATHVEALVAWFVHQLPRHDGFFLYVRLVCNRVCTRHHVPHVVQVRLDGRFVGEERARIRLRRSAHPASQRTRGRSCQCAQTRVIVRCSVV